jgi:sialidase-1
VIYSDDHGANWRPGEIVAAHPDPVNPSETAAVELADGRVMLNIRHESEPHLRGVSISRDGATGWSKVRFDPALPEPVCFGSLIRLPRRPGSEKDRILFVNPHNPTDRVRRNLTVKLSEDGGRSWPVSRVIDPGPGGYADLAAGPDGTLFCLYERGTTGSGGANPRSLCLARFDLAWLTSGNDAGAGRRR